MTSIAISATLLILVIAGLSVFSQLVLKPLWRPTASALISFDIAGITKRIAAPASRLADSKEFVEQIGRCYTPEEWDTLVRQGCAAGYDGHVYHTYIADKYSVLGEWGTAIVNNPLAYASHRIAHFMCLLRVNCNGRPAIGIALNDVKRNPRAVDVPTLAIRYEQTARAFFWAVPPWIMFLGATGMTLWAGYVGFSRGACEGGTALVVFALGGSALIYTAGYLLVGIAGPFRYVYWPYQALWLAVMVAPMMTSFRMPSPRSNATGTTCPCATPQSEKAQNRINRPEHF